MNRVGCGMVFAGYDGPPVHLWQPLPDIHNLSSFEAFLSKTEAKTIDICRSPRTIRTDEHAIELSSCIWTKALFPRSSRKPGCSFLPAKCRPSPGSEPG